MKQSVLQTEYRTLEFLLWCISNQINDDKGLFYSILIEMYHNNDMKCYTIATESLRNYLRILTGNGESFLLKQPKKLENNSTLVNEEKIYTVFESIEEIKCFLPHKVRFFSEFNVLVTKHFPVENLYQAFSRKEKPNATINYRETIAFSIGETLSLIHTNLRSSVSNHTFDTRFPNNTPYVTISKLISDEHFFDSITNKALLDYSLVEFSNFNNPTLKNLIIEFSKLWNNNDFIHFDLATRNMIYWEDKVIFLDWEMCGWGDKIWDVVCCLNSILDTIYIDSSLIVQVSVNTSSPKFTQAKNMINQFLIGYFGEEELAIHLAKIEVYWMIYYLKVIVQSDNNFSKVSQTLNFFLPKNESIR
ncbi:phosphotransferase [Flectobacillus rivi]|uniref:Phosphotransferase n=1 Tax=Flectobacillus rivi TaxID=2984209 RepID=A0ABT6YZ13_9BACT|nr:phosphotransferase [Flectobacillus rivi]MDI9874107.1 phosphotransferase [Flectobacillus rivi]